MKHILRVATAALAVAFAAHAWAQGSLMDVGKGLLQNQLGAPSSATSGGTRGAGLATGEIASGLTEALKVAAERVTGRLGAPDGYNGDPAVHVPLPGSLDTVRQGLKMAGQSALLDDLELRLNRAAEAAAPQAKKIFWDALSRMTLDDARAIFNGPQDAATQYFKRTMTPDLKTAMRPVVDRSVSEAGAVKAYQASTAAASKLPVVGSQVQSAPGQLTDHVLEYGLNGIFRYLGDEEAAIRTDPAKRSTDLLRKVFGG
ncbi:MAG: DUF4197 domain-containing protein [Actinomycetota bacterium]